MKYINWMSQQVLDWKALSKKFQKRAKLEIDKKIRQIEGRFALLS